MIYTYKQLTEMSLKDFYKVVLDHQISLHPVDEKHPFNKLWTENIKEINEATHTLNKHLIMFHKIHILGDNEIKSLLSSLLSVKNTLKDAYTHICDKANAVQASSEEIKIENYEDINEEEAHNDKYHNKLARFKHTETNVYIYGRLKYFKGDKKRNFCIFEKDKDTLIAFYNVAEFSRNIRIFNET